MRELAVALGVLLSTGCTDAADGLSFGPGTGGQGCEPSALELSSDEPSQFGWSVADLVAGFSGHSESLFVYDPIVALPATGITVDVSQAADAVEHACGDERVTFDVRLRIETDDGRIAHDDLARLSVDATEASFGWSQYVDLSPGAYDVRFEVSWPIEDGAIAGTAGSALASCYHLGINGVCAGNQHLGFWAEGGE